MHSVLLFAAYWLPTRYDLRPWLFFTIARRCLVPLGAMQFGRPRCQPNVAMHLHPHTSQHL